MSVIPSVCDKCRQKDYEIKNLKEEVDELRAKNNYLLLSIERIKNRR